MRISPAYGESEEKQPDGSLSRLVWRLNVVLISLIEPLLNHWSPTKSISTHMFLQWVWKLWQNPEISPQKNKRKEKKISMTTTPSSPLVFTQGRWNESRVRKVCDWQSISHHCLILYFSDAPAVLTALCHMEGSLAWASQLLFPVCIFLHNSGNFITGSTYNKLLPTWRQNASRI